MKFMLNILVDGSRFVATVSLSQSHHLFSENFSRGAPSETLFWSAVQAVAKSPSDCDLRAPRSGCRVAGIGARLFKFSFDPFCQGACESQNQLSISIPDQTQAFPTRDRKDSQVPYRTRDGCIRRPLSRPPVLHSASAAESGTEAHKGPEPRRVLAPRRRLARP